MSFLKRRTALSSLLGPRAIAAVWGTVLAAACAVPDVASEDVDVAEQNALTQCSEGEVDVLEPWDDQGVVNDDDWDYTGISAPQDQGLIDAENAAADAMNGEGCMFGAHGQNPDHCGGQTGIQSFPNDTSESICHNEYAPNCVGKPLVLSVCFGGKEGGPGTAPISDLFVERCGVNPEDIVACTGPVSPGQPMRCKGTLVDGNGDPIGDQQIGDLDIVEVPPTRGEGGAGGQGGSGGDDGLWRCEDDDPCPVCDPCESGMCGSGGFGASSSSGSGGYGASSSSGGSGGSGGYGSSSSSSSGSGASGGF